MQTFSQRDSNNFPLDYKLDMLFNQKQKGFFIELGANNGLTQSNTAFFEKYRNWKGILIEPSLQGFEQCKINRPNSLCLNYACVSNEYNEECIKGDFIDNNCMSSINGNRLQRNLLINVKATTLEKILKEHVKSNYQIDLLSLDVEGYELNVLKGLNLEINRPKYMLIEVYTKDYDEIISYLEKYNYKLHSNFSNYNSKDNPFWDGTHNDFLFYDINN